MLEGVVRPTPSSFHNFTRFSRQPQNLGMVMSLLKNIETTTGRGLVARYVSHMTGTSTAIGLRLEGFHHSKHEDDILIQARKADEGLKIDFTGLGSFL